MLVWSAVRDFLDNKGCGLVADTAWGEAECCIGLLYHNPECCKSRTAWHGNIKWFKVFFLSAIYCLALHRSNIAIKTVQCAPYRMLQGLCHLRNGRSLSSAHANTLSVVSFCRKNFTPSIMFNHAAWRRPRLNGKHYFRLFCVPPGLSKPYLNLDLTSSYPTELKKEVSIVLSKPSRWLPYIGMKDWFCIF